MHRLWLVARREIVAYAGVPSFWVALLTGPLLMLLAALGAGEMARTPAPPAARMVAIEAPNAQLAAAMKHAIEEAADIEGRPDQVRIDGAGPAAVRVRLTDGLGGPALSVQGEPLSKISVALLRRDVAAALRGEALTGDEARATDIAVHEPTPRPRPRRTRGASPASR